MEYSKTKIPESLMSAIDNVLVASHGEAVAVPGSTWRAVDKLRDEMGKYKACKEKNYVSGGELLDDEDLDRLIETADPGPMSQSYYDTDVHLALVELRCARRLTRLVKALMAIGIGMTLVVIMIHLWRNSDVNPEKSKPVSQPTAERDR